MLWRGPSDPSEPAKESLCKADEGLVGRFRLDLAPHRAGLEPEEIFQDGHVRHLHSSAQATFLDCPFVWSGHASTCSVLPHFIKLPPGALGQHRGPHVNERRSSLVHHIAAQRAVLIIDGLVYMSMAIRHRVLLSMFPSPVAVRFGSSQQLVWVVGFSSHGGAFIAGGREAAVAARRGSFVRRSIRGEQKGTHGENGERRGQHWRGFILYL